MPSRTEKVCDGQDDLFVPPLNIIRITGLQKYAKTADLDVAELHSTVVSQLQEMFASHEYVQSGEDPTRDLASQNIRGNQNLLTTDKYTVSHNGRKLLFFVGEDFSSFEQAVYSAGVTNVLIFSIGKFRKNTIAKQLGRSFNYIKMPLPEVELSDCPISYDNILPDVGIRDASSHFLLQDQMKEWSQRWHKMPHTLRCFIENALTDYLSLLIDRLLGPISTIAGLFIKCCRKQ